MTTSVWPATWHTTTFQSAVFEDLLSVEGEQPIIPDPVDVGKDPLAVILHYKQLNDFPTIPDDFINCVPTAEQFERAAAIRSYYMDKISTQKLSGTFCETEFKKDLVTALRLSEKNNMRQDLNRILYRLDDFYNEDVAFDRIVTLSSPILCKKRTDFRIKDLSLTFLEMITVVRKGSKVKKYFFTDSDNKLFCIDAPSHNSLSSFLDLAISHFPQIVITGRTVRKHIWDHNFSYLVITPDSVTECTSSNT